MNFRAPWVSSRSTAYCMSRLSSRSGATSRRYRSACREPWSSAYRSSRLVTACAKVGALGQLLGPGQGRLAQLPVRLTAGCAVVAVTVAAADDDLRDHAGTIFRTWTERLTELCTARVADASVMPSIVAANSRPDGDPRAPRGDGDHVAAPRWRGHHRGPPLRDLPTPRPRHRRCLRRLWRRAVDHRPGPRPRRPPRRAGAELATPARLAYHPGLLCPVHAH